MNGGQNGRKGGQPEQPRALAEGALLAAIAALMVLLASFIPPLFILSALAPVPLVVAVVRNGWRVGLLAGFVTALLLSLFLGLLALLTGLTLAAAGIGLGIGLRKKWPAAATLTLGTLISLGTTLLTIWIALNVMGLDFVDMMMSAVESGYEQSMVLLQQLEGRLGSSTDMGAFEAEMARALELLPLLVPGVLTAVAATTAFVNYAVSTAVLRRLGSNIPPLPPFKRWNLPPSAVYALVIVFASIRGVEYFGYEQQAAPFMPAFMSAAWLLQTAVVGNGLTTGYFFLRRWRLPRWLAATILVFGFFNPWFQALFFWIGFLEPFLKVRSRFNGPQPDEQKDENDGAAANNSGGETDESHSFD